MSLQGDVWVECTLSFKGNVRLSLYDGMTIAEAIHDILHCGDYEYEVVSGNIDIDNVEEID